MGHPKLTGEEIDRRFMQVVGRGKVAQMHKMLRAFPQLLESRWDQRTPLTEACRWNEPNACALGLLEAGADPNASRLDDPQWRPLRLALRSRADLVPALLERGARPWGAYPQGKYRSDQAPDIVVAATACPQHVGALIQAGADPNAASENDATALGVVLNQLLKGGAETSPTEPHWVALRALVEGGAHLDGTARLNDPAWFVYWQLRFSNLPMPSDAPQLFDALQPRITDPGMRVQGRTFVHAIATQLRREGMGQRQQDAWQGLLASYGEPAIGQWLSSSKDDVHGFKSACAELVPLAPELPVDEHTWVVACDRLVDALDWAAEFIRVGGVDRVSTGQDMACVLSRQWPWTILKDERIRMGIQRAQLDLVGDGSGASPAQQFQQACGRKDWPRPEPGEIESLVLAAQSAPASSHTPRPRF